MRTIRSNKVVVTSAAVVLILAASPGEALGAQRVEGALPERSMFHGAAIELIQSGDERPSQAGSPGLGHGLQLAELRLDAGKLGEAASEAISRWPATQKADPA